MPEPTTERTMPDPLEAEHRRQIVEAAGIHHLRESVARLDATVALYDERQGPSR